MTLSARVQSDFSLTFRRALIAVAWLISFAAGPVFSQTNSWFKPASGYWEEQAYWSLGVLPDASQAVAFTNAGWKALAIGYQTALSYPQSLSVKSILLSAPEDSYNVLLMNFSGFDVPLRTEGLRVETNSAVVLQSSALEVLGGPLTINGSVSHGDYSRVTATAGMTLQWGSYYLTNGTLATGGLEDFGGTSRFVQFGGEHSLNRMQIFDRGEYHLEGGQVQASSLLVSSSRGGFFQHGGTLTAIVDVGGDFSGRYILAGGNRTGRMWIPAARGSGHVQQGGGTNHADFLMLGNASRFGGVGTYVLSNGVVTVDTSTTLRGFGTFEQWVGRHVIVSNLTMGGVDLHPYGKAPARYLLHGGTIAAAGLTLRGGSFEQSGGSNLIAGEIAVGPAELSSLYSLTAGILLVSNLTLHGAVESGFSQAGGTNMVRGILTLAGQGKDFYGYTLAGGRLSVNELCVSNGAAFYHRGGEIDHGGALTLAGGAWHSRPGEQALGALRLLGGPGSNSMVVFPREASELRLAGSSGQTWEPSAVLLVGNWHGSATGGGDTRLFFGADPNGLTAQQLEQVRFSLNGSQFPARMLASGEVVPRGYLTWSYATNTLWLEWEPGRTLQSATDVAGPWQDVSEASSPHPVSSQQPSQFFRLRP